MMDPISVMNSFNKIGKYFLVFILLINLTGVSFAGDSIISAMSSLCETASALLATGAMLLIILAAAVYAIGQIVGAETRARASVWATAMITGALIGIVIYLVVPNLIGFLMTGTGTDERCGFTITTT
jgi:hypothetical protein